MDREVDSMGNQVVSSAVKQAELHRRDGVGLEIVFINQFSINKAIQRA